MKNALKHTVEQLDAVRDALLGDHQDAERLVLLEQEASLLQQVDKLFPDPKSRKSTGTVGPQGETRRKVRA